MSHITGLPSCSTSNIAETPANPQQPFRLPISAVMNIPETSPGKTSALSESASAITSQTVDVLPFGPESFKKDICAFGTSLSIIAGSFIENKNNGTSNIFREQHEDVRRLFLRTMGLHNSGADFSEITRVAEGRSRRRASSSVVIVGKGSNQVPASSSMTYIEGQKFYRNIELCMIAFANDTELKAGVQSLKKLSEEIEYPGLQKLRFCLFNDLTKSEQIFDAPDLIGLWRKAQTVAQVLADN